MSMREAHKLNLKQCIAIRDNQYRSKDCRIDYYPESIEERINILQGKRIKENFKAIMKELEAVNDELPPPIPSECDEGLDAQYDYLLAADEYVIHRHLNGFSYQVYRIPGIICPF